MIDKKTLINHPVFWFCFGFFIYFGWFLADNKFEFHHKMPAFLSGLAPFFLGFFVLLILAPDFRKSKKTARIKLYSLLGGGLIGMLIANGVG